MTADRLLLVRCDANVAIGTGHAMRCLALAQAWQDSGGRAIFAMARSTPAIEERLRLENVRMISVDEIPGSVGDLQQTINFARAHHAEWLVVDGYHFDAHYLAGLQQVRAVLVVDDNGDREFYSADVLLNQNAHARAEMYPGQTPQTRLLLGTRYALLRNEFMPYRNWERQIPQRGSRILLTMGGSDPKHLTLSILHALSESPMEDLQIRVVIGGSAENCRVVTEAVHNCPGRVEVMSNVTNMAKLMAWADLAIAGAGATCWEMCLLSLPAIVVVVAENQRLIAEGLENMGAAVNAGPAETIVGSTLAQTTAELADNPDRRLRMSQAARQLVDGKGRERVLETMRGGGTPCV